MASVLVGVALAAAMVQVPFGSEVTVHCENLPADLELGTERRGWLVSAVAPSEDSDQATLRLRPLVLGFLPVPCEGGEPVALDVVPSLPPDAGPAPPRLLLPARFSWAPVTLGVLFAGGAAGLAWRLRRRQTPPGLALARTLRPLVASDAWSDPAAPDLLAGACRRYLAAATVLPAGAMTAGELAAALRRPGPGQRAVLEALHFCDRVRYAGEAPTVGPVVVARVLAAAGGRREVT